MMNREINLCKRCKEDEYICQCNHKKTPLEKRLEKREGREKICEECKGKYKSRRSDQRFCSGMCYQKFAYKKKYVKKK